MIGRIVEITTLGSPVLTPIPGHNVSSAGVQKIDGWVGTIFVLMEANATPSGTGFLAYTWFDTTVAEMLTNAVTSELWINLGFTNGDFEPNLNVALSDYITAHVRDKIVAESNHRPR
jgi:hypothetical protein